MGPKAKSTIKKVRIATPIVENAQLRIRFHFIFQLKLF